jgi:hypothetical protein
MHPYTIHHTPYTIHYTPYTIYTILTCICRYSFSEGYTFIEESVPMKELEKKKVGGTRLD